MFKVKEGENLTTGIPLVFRGFRFESDAEIGQKGTFFKGLEVFTCSNDFKERKER
jgi:hypothetical protein